MRFKLNKHQNTHNYVQNSPKLAPKPWMFDRTDGRTIKISDGITVHLPRFVARHKMQFNHFPIISQWKISVAMATKPKGRQPLF